MALLTPGSAGAQEAPRGPCFDFQLDDAAEILPRVSMVIVGSVTQSERGDVAVIAPEVYLKGATSNEAVELPYPAGQDDCEAAELPQGERVLLVLGKEDGHVAWPGATQTFILRDGQAHQGTPDSDPTMAEDDLVDQIRAHTGQYSIPAASEDESARLDWTGTVLPVGIAVFIVFGIGLVLMREWHRIDPS